MCRDNDHGGRRCPSAQLDSPKRQINRLYASMAKEITPERRHKLEDRLIVAVQQLDAIRNRIEDKQEALSSLVVPSSPVPEHLIINGKTFNELHDFTTDLPEEYNPDEYEQVINRERREDTTPGKPCGGLWFSPTETNGKSAWHNLIEYDDDDDDNSDAQNVSHNVVFNDDARIVKINNWDEYKELVDSCERPARFIKWTSNSYLETTNKGIDYERLNLDGIYFTQSAISQISRKTGVEGSADSNYESVYGWDISSGVILNKDMVSIVRK